MKHLAAISGLIVLLCACASSDVPLIDYRAQGEVVKDWSEVRVNFLEDQSGIESVERIPPSESDFSRCIGAGNMNGLVSVELAFDVNRAGETENIRVLRTSDRCFNIAAGRSLEKWTFSVSESASDEDLLNHTTMIKFAWGN